MKLSEFKTELSKLQDLVVQLPNGTTIPSHFHITEVGLLTRHFIDCGGTVRTLKTINLQIWIAQDVEHRLKPEKLLHIIHLAQPLWGEEDLELEFEYQATTIEKYHVQAQKGIFLLQPTQTGCLAEDACGSSQIQPQVEASCCTPGGGCC